ncbi:hypothetical protein BGP77_14495 [Saccharospirillum sp. MSK14-1]|uniref:DUF3461 family protein n=1 Tax=Saccharospirillum sp. MSK14-1 TaxID=1897632 RepID=UPI000D39F093|nr:DUF3461 family protein [Saccharospirillum sp. MSK14-1]PTY37691.1 hypothetical protein BGP77_14495 [Saccharospirillum sp. MSK14-1]
MFEHLNAVGVTDTDKIEKYTLRTEGYDDILKIYYKREKGDLFARSEKFKYPRQQKRVKVDSGTGSYLDTTEISPALRQLVDELDSIARRVHVETDLKKKILDDLHHLEKVVQNKIEEIEADIKRLK